MIESVNLNLILQIFPLIFEVYFHYNTKKKEIYDYYFSFFNHLH